MWALHGHVHNHPKYGTHHFISVSTPRAFDPETNVVTTKSGSQYQLIDFAPGTIEQIQKDIESGGYEIH